MARVLEAKGTDVASATTITLPGNGNYFQITGAVTIDGIVTAGWQSGASITLYFVSTPTITNASGAPGAGAAAILTATGTNFVASAGNTLTLLYDSALASWKETARATTMAGGGTWAAVLATGNSSGGTSPVITSGDAISGQTVVTTGGTLPLRGGLATLAGGTGGPVVVSTATSGAGTTYVERVRVSDIGTTFFGDGTLATAAGIGGAGANGSVVTGYRTGFNSQLALLAFDTSAGPEASVVLGKSRGTAAAPTIVADGDSVGSIYFQAGNSATQQTRLAQIRVFVDGAPGAVSDMPGRMVFYTTPDGSGTIAERMRINNLGTTFFGDGTLSATFGGSGAASVPQWSYRGTGGCQNAISTYDNVTAADGSILNLQRGRGTPATPAAVSSGDTIGRILFQQTVAAGSNNTAAEIRCETDGSVATNDSPGRLLFYTVPDGSGAAVERMRINNLGTTFFGDGTIASTFEPGAATTSVASYRNNTNSANLYTFSAAGAANRATITFYRGRGTAAVPAIVADGDQLGSVSFATILSTTSVGVAALITAFSDGTPVATTSSPGRMVFSTTPSGATVAVERMRINNLGTTFFGDGTLNATQAAGVANTSLFSYRSATSNVEVLGTYSAANVNDCGILTLMRGRGSPASPVIVNSGDSLGILAFAGMQSATAFASGAQITAEVDGTPGAAADMPGRLLFSTSADGSATPTERLRINAAGTIFAGNGETAGAPAAATIRGTGGSGAAVAGATLTISGGANSGSGNSNGGGLTLIAPTANAAGTNGALTLTAHAQSYTFNDASNTAFTGTAAAATSLVGAINLVSSAATMSSRSTLFQTSGLTLTSVIAAGVLAVDGDAMVIEAWGDGVATETLSVTVFGTTVLSATAAGTSAYWARLTLIRTTSTNVDVIGSFQGASIAPTRTSVAAVSGNIVSTAGTTGVARGHVVFKAADA